MTSESYETLRPLMFSVAYRMLGSASEAEDVVQDAWLRLTRDDRSNVRPQDERRSAALRAVCQPRHVTMCATGDKPFETGFEFWCGIRLYDAERAEAMDARLFGEGRLDRARVVQKSRSA